MYFVAMFITIDWIFGKTYDRNVGLWGETIITIVIGIGIMALINILWEKFIRLLDLWNGWSSKRIISLILFDVRC